MRHGNHALSWEYDILWSTWFWAFIVLWKSLQSYGSYWRKELVCISFHSHLYVHFLLNNTDSMYILLFKKLMRYWVEKPEIVSTCLVSLMPLTVQEAFFINLHIRHQTCIIFMLGSNSFLKIILSWRYASSFILLDRVNYKLSGVPWLLLAGFINKNENCKGNTQILSLLQLLLYCMWFTVSRNNL